MTTAADPLLRAPVPASSEKEVKAVPIAVAVEVVAAVPLGDAAPERADAPLVEAEEVPYATVVTPAEEPEPPAEVEAVPVGAPNAWRRRDWRHILGSAPCARILVPFLLVLLLLVHIECRLATMDRELLSPRARDNSLRGDVGEVQRDVDKIKGMVEKIQRRLSAY